MRLSIAFIFMAGVALAADAPAKAAPPAPRNVAFSPAAQQAIAALNEKASLYKEAYDAKVQVLQFEFKEVLEKECRAAGAENCQPNIQGTNPAAWGFTVPPKAAEQKPNDIPPHP
jgi:hypothetical protein